MGDTLGEGLTLISVASTPQDETFLYHNLKLIRSLNGPEHHRDLRWLVVCNKEITDPRLTSESVFTFLPGSKNTDAHRAGSGSYHHSQGLLSAIPHIKTRFALFIDPDCFMVRKNWISEVLGHMRERGLSFFGIPNHPKKATSWRRFPYVAGLFIDLGRVPKEEIDFTPSAYEMEWLLKLGTGAMFKWALSGRPSVPVPSDLNPERRDIVKMLKSRVIGRVLGSRTKIAIPMTSLSGDTSVRLYHRFVADPSHVWDAAIPLWDHREIFAKYSALDKLVWCLLPESLRYVPKDKKTALIGDFRRFGAYDVDSLFRCESYVWKDEPFAFHVRGNGVKDVPASTLEEVFQSFA